ncbi:MAG: secondary thiamine-phosphate synthase enzyme YjbQ [Planctomycetales bacterium]|nr:secondary thiamine-phosphate synthase enzyme YjbQ [Planctomycetales bacterium]
MNWSQKTILLRARARGFHLITNEICDELPEIEGLKVGLLHLFLQHTSASLTINENADPDVRRDLEVAFNHCCPDDLPFIHTCEGPDDMPAHVKSSTLGCQLTIPISRGELALGVWQGIYLCEHRDHATSRRVVATLFGTQED